MSKWAEDIVPGDRLPGGDVIEDVQHIAVGPEWIVAAWVRDADYDGTGLPTITWHVGDEVELADTHEAGQTRIRLTRRGRRVEAALVLTLLFGSGTIVALIDGLL